WNWFKRLVGFASNEEAAILDQNCSDHVASSAPTMAQRDPIIAPDSPIESASQDVLGRTGFALNLARALANLVRGPGVVIGLNGIWGSGKSSLKNLIIEELVKSDVDVEILEFNPWQYESSDQLT